MDVEMTEASYEVTWKDIKRATLQRMFVIEGGTVVVSDVTQPYIEAMPAAANEGIYLLAAAGGVDLDIHIRLGG